MESQAVNAGIQYKPKRDGYARSRGASQFFNLSCASCGTFLALYQKDGPGTLKRLYLDRIFAPAPQCEWQNLRNLKDVPKLVCASCNTLIGTPMIYARENRLAIRLIAGRFSKVRSNGTYTPPTPTEGNKGEDNGSSGGTG